MATSEADRRPRRATRAYRRARFRVIPLWTGVVALAALAPWPLTLAAGLFTTCLTFAFLDERSG
jgi:hypothetical protein